MDYIIDTGTLSPRRANPDNSASSMRRLSVRHLFACGLLTTCKAISSKNLGGSTSELKKNLLVQRRLICLLFSKWRDWDLNPEPMAYESTAPPLSYLAQCPKILPEIYVKVKPFCAFIIICGSVRAITRLRPSLTEIGVSFVPLYNEN